MSGAVLQSKKAIKKEGRSTIDSRVLKDGDVPIVRWQDAASTLVRVGAFGKAKRWSKKEKSYIEVDQTDAIKYYKDFMGRVDLIDDLPDDVKEK